MLYTIVCSQEYSFLCSALTSDRRVSFHCERTAARFCSSFVLVLFLLYPPEALVDASTPLTIVYVTSNLASCAVTLARWLAGSMDINAPGLHASSPPANSNAQPVGPQRATCFNKSLLDLPAEIRNLIYHFLFPEGQSAVRLLARHTGTGYIQMSDRLGILTTCRQVYDETSSFLKCRNRFEVEQPEDIHGLFCTLIESEDEDGVCRNRLLDHILPPEGLQFNYNLDNRTSTNNIPALLKIDGWWRGTGMISARNPTVTAKMSTRDKVTTFENFRLLRQWQDHGLMEPLPRTEFCNWKKQIILVFEMSEATDLADVRFLAESFMNATSEGKYKISPIQADVVLHVRYAGSVKVNKVQLCDIHAEILHFLRQSIIRYPILKYRPLPRLWLDGQFHVRDIDFLRVDGIVERFANQMEPWRVSEKWCRAEKLQAMKNSLMRGLSPGDPDWSSGEYGYVWKETWLGTAIALANYINRLYC